MTQLIRQSDLTNLILNCAYAGCQIIGNAPTNLIMQFKEQNDPVTQVDHAVQKYIAETLTQMYPGIKIVGQETIDESLLQSFPAYQKNFKDLNIPEKFLHLQNQQISLEDLCVFIDPLDGTRGFVSGKKWECTVLIGVVYKGQTIIGAIGQPFTQNNNDTAIYQPKVLIGGTILKENYSLEFYVDQNNVEQWKIYNPTIKDQSEEKKAAISSRRNSKKAENILNSIDVLKQTCGGSGNKLGKLIRGEVDLVMFVDAPTSTWDSCAGQAIIQSMNGFFFKPDLSAIKYEFQQENQLNKEGFIACFDIDMTAKICHSLSQQSS